MTRRISTLAYVVLILALAAGALARPTYGWDMLGYIGAVVALDHTDTAAIQATTYADVRTFAPPNEYALLVGDRGTDAASYRRDVAHDADHFAQQLPFYRVRPLYIGAQYVLYKLGIDPVRAIYLLSALGYVLTGLLLFAWSRRYLPAPYAASASLLLMVSPPLLLVARSAVPDALSAATLLLAVYALVELRRRGLFAALMLIAILVRNDNALFATLLFVYLGLFAPEGRSRLPLFAGAVGAVVAYYAIERWAGAYGWATLFHHTFIAFLPAPGHTPAAVSPSTYAHVVVVGLRSVLDTMLPLFAMLWVVAFGARHGANPLMRGLLLVIAATLVLRYLLFPVLFDRMLAPYYVLIVAVLIAIASRAVATALSNDHPALGMRRAS